MQPTISQPPRTGIWQNPALVVLMTTLAFLFLGGLGNAIGMWVANSMDVDVTAILQNGTARSLTLIERQGIRWQSLLGHLFSFTGTALLIASLARQQESITNFLGLRKAGLNGWLGLGVVILLLGLPFIMLVNWLNLQIPLPAWLAEIGSSTDWLVQEVLRMESPQELLMALLVAAVVPALGEELLFRGLIQPQFQKMVQGPHLGIWLTAILFSAIHMQFAGFFPRMLLGAFLGYAYYWSGTLWAPIILHFIFNGLQIMGIYFSPDLFSDPSEISMEWPQLIAGAISGVLVYWLLTIWQKAYNDRQAEEVVEI